VCAVVAPSTGLDVARAILFPVSQNIIEVFFFARDLVIIASYFVTNSFCGLTSLPFGSMLSGSPCFDGCTSRFS
jgi:hypothetical protein